MIVGILSIGAGEAPAFRFSDVYLAWRKNAALFPAASVLVDAIRRV